MHYVYELLQQLGSEHRCLPIGTVMIKSHLSDNEVTVVCPRTGRIHGWAYCGLKSPKKIRRYATLVPSVWGGGSRMSGPARKAVRKVLGGRQVMWAHTAPHGNRYRIVRRLYGADVYVVQLHSTQGWQDVAPCGSKVRKYKTLRGARAHAEAVIKAGGPYAWHRTR